jgi:hypothetical protein
MDVHVPRAVTTALRLRGVDVRTAQDDEAALLDDASLLNRSTQLGRVLVSQDDDLLRVGAQFQRAATVFAGIVYAHQLQVTIGQFVEGLELIAKATDPDDWDRRIEFLPLR